MDLAPEGEGERATTGRRSVETGSTRRVREASEVTLEAGREVQGKVSWADGRPAGHVLIEALLDGEDRPAAHDMSDPSAEFSTAEDGRPYTTALSDRSGRFRLQDLPLRPCTLRMIVPPLPPRQRFVSPEAVRALLKAPPGAPTVLPAAATAVDLTIPHVPPQWEDGEIRLKVVSRQFGTAVLSAEALLTNGTLEVQPIVEGPGQLRFTHLPEGDWFLRVRGASFVPTFQRVRLEQGQRLGPLEVPLECIAAVFVPVSAGAPRISGSFEPVSRSAGRDIMRPPP